MALLTPSGLNTEFQEMTSAQMLRAPEPDYIYATLAKASLQGSLGGAQIPGQAWKQHGAGVNSLESERLYLSDPLLADAITTVAELGPGKAGLTVRMNRRVFTDSVYTLASRALVPGSAISTTPLNISQEQVHITLQELSGPHGGSVVQPYGISKLAQMRSIHDLQAEVGLHMRRDLDKVLHGIFNTLLEEATTTVYPNGVTADNDMTVADGSPLTLDQLWKADLALDQLNAPKFANGKRMCVLNPKQVYQLKGDSDFMRAVDQHRDVNPLLSQNFVASIAGLDIYRSNALDTDTNSSSVTVLKGHIFGPGMLGMGMAEMPKIVANTNTDYERQLLVVWYMVAGFGVLDQRFGAVIKNA